MTTSDAPRFDWLSTGEEFQLYRSWGNWHLMSRRYLVWNTRGPSLDGYDIDLWEINTHKELVDWLFHVGGKTFDPHDFFDAMRDIFRSAGWSEAFSGKDLTIAYWGQSAPHHSRPRLITD